MTPNEFCFFSLFLTLSFVLATWRITLRFLQFFQQEEYTTSRFLIWWMRSRSFEKRAALTAVLCALVIGIMIPADFVYTPDHTRSVSYFYIRVIPFAIILVIAGWSNKILTHKKALVMTSRAKRIFSLTMLLQATAFYLSVFIAFLVLKTSAYNPISVGFVHAALSIQLIPLLMVAANQCLSPIESAIQRKYLDEAREILRRFKPTIIGITGSYGKTSTKHVLNHVLNTHAPSLATPGSVNTLMGVTRIIRERLKIDHRYFIVEMGAYGIGSIRQLCDFTPPGAAIVTSVGIAHLERFKSIETIARAKSELPQALSRDGIAILNGDDPNVRAMAKSIQAQTGFFGRSVEAGDPDCRLIADAVTENGTRMTLEYEGKRYTVELPLYGSHQAMNATAAFLLSVRLGVPPITAIAALKTVPPIEHRFVVMRGSDGITTIDDAYNSNPDGFNNALDVLAVLKGNRKILVTPGMVELGERADEEHARIAVKAVTVCTHVCLVAPHRIQALRSGLLQNGFPSENLHEFESLGDAREWLGNNMERGDIVLFENDLPDLYETVSAFKLF